MTDWAAHLTHYVDNHYDAGEGIERYCRQLGGGYVRFSQAREPVKSMIRTKDFSQGGICQALSAKWIAEHANGRSLWTWLADRRTGQAVDRAKIGNLMINFAESKLPQGPLANPTTTIHAGNMDERLRQMGGLCYQDFVTTRNLGIWGLHLRSLGQRDGFNRGAAGTTPRTGLMLAEQLTRRRLLHGLGPYVLISLMGGPRSGHTVAAFLSDDIAFFDPNFGEFYFEDRAAFAEWFGRYWLHSDYTSKYGSFYILSYYHWSGRSPEDHIRPLPMRRTA